MIASLAKWKVGATGPSGRISGAVCGQDPRYVGYFPVVICIFIDAPSDNGFVNLFRVSLVTQFFTC